MFTTVVPNVIAPIMFNVGNRQSLGDHLYSLVESNLQIGKDTMIKHNFWIPTMTAGKIVGMMIDGLNHYELIRACSDPEYLGEIMLDACEVLMIAAGRRPFYP